MKRCVSHETKFQVLFMLTLYVFDPTFLTRLSLEGKPKEEFCFDTKIEYPKAVLLENIGEAYHKHPSSMHHAQQQSSFHANCNGGGGKAAVGSNVGIQNIGLGAESRQLKRLPRVSFKEWPVALYKLTGCYRLAALGLRHFCVEEIQTKSPGHCSSSCTMIKYYLSRKLIPLNQVENHTTVEVA